MQYRALGNSGLKVSAISLGSWLTFGNGLDGQGAGTLVRAALELGINLFDTADVYKNGEGETVLGQAIRGLPRHKLVIASKCFFPMSDDPNDRGLSRKHVCESVDASLRRLQTDYLDLYQCHRFDPDVPLLETARAMDELIRRGKVLYWGVSQWPAVRIAEIAALCREQRLHAPISDQPLYNLFERGIEADVLPACRAHGLGTICYSPLAQGVLTGKYRAGAAPPPQSRAADRRMNQFVDRYLTPERLQQAAALAALAERNGHQPGQLALAFCLRTPGVCSLIVGARDLQQLRDNVAAAALQPGDDLCREVESLFPIAPAS